VPPAANPRLAAALAGRYRLLRELGAGGMATVYLAGDERHDREVAVKVLRPELAAVIGAERFLAEIKTTARLQHPHILPLHDSGEADGFLYYVMPYVEGISLRERIAREHQLPVSDAVRIAREVAGALDYAHRHGVIHRDIKPENILLHDGSALVADFGIALAVSTADTRLTETGMSLGTPHYMSPEQAMGEREITARSDVYALGCVTYEMLSGEPPFTGPTAQAIIARVMTDDPRPLSTQRRTVPAYVEQAVLTALEKLPADRFATAAEFEAALGGEAPAGTARTVAMRRSAVPAPAAIVARRHAFLRWAWVPAAALFGIALGFVAARRTATPAPLLQASIAPPPGDCVFADVGGSNLIQLSPDGSSLVVVAICGGTRALWVRSLATGAMRQLPGTGNALYPFWSPDGQSLGFFAEGRLKRIDLASGTVRDLAPALAGRGGTWSRAGTIVYAPDVFSPLSAVPAAGGTPRVVTTLPKGDQMTHRLPLFLADGRHFLFTEGHGSDVMGALLVGDLESAATRRVSDLPSNVALSEGRIFYVRDGAVFAQPVTAAGDLRGTPVSLLPAVETWPFKFLGNFSVVGKTLVYVAPQGQERQVLWFDPATRVVTPLIRSASIRSAELSPDGLRILLDRTSAESQLVDAWIYTPANDSWTRLTTHPDFSYTMAWSPDGDRVALKAARDSITHVLDADRREVARYAGAAPGLGPIEDWSPDGSYAVGSRQVSQTGLDITRLTFDSAGSRLEPLIATDADESTPRISPSGRALAYLSTESGRPEVYVTSLPTARARLAVSLDGAISEAQSQGSFLTWSHDGRTLYYVDASGYLMAVPITETPSLAVGRPARVPGSPDGLVNVTAAPDGRLLLLAHGDRGKTLVTVVSDWTRMAH
jgi:serine/threonine-protein kinase